MASRKLLAGGVSLLGLIGILVPAAALADAAATGHHVSAPEHARKLPATRVRQNLAQTAFWGHLENYNLAIFGVRCLGISRGKRDADAVLAGCVKHPDQEWTAGSRDGAGYYRIYNGYGQCLGVSGGETHNGARVVATKCLSGHNDQEWLMNLISDCGNYYPIFNEKAKDKVIGVQANSTTTGAPIVIWEYQFRCNNQDWGSTGS